MKPLPAKEQDIQGGILRFLDVKKRQVEAQGGNLWCGKMHTGPLLVGSGVKVPNPMAGFPDVPCLYRRKGEARGQLIGIEVKRPGEKRSQAQIDMHAALTAAGAICIVAESVDAVVLFFTEYEAQERSAAAADELRRVW